MQPCPDPPNTLCGDGPIAVRRLSLAAPTRRRAAATHPFAALLYYTGGRSVVELGGEWTLAPGDALLIPAGAPHRTLDVARAELWGLSFTAPRLGPGDDALLAPFDRVRDGASAVVRIPDARRGFLEGLLRELGDATAPARRGGSLAAQRSLLTLIVGEVARAASPPARTLDAPTVVTESLRVIERRCLGPLTLREVAAAVGRTPSYVTTALTRATGRSAVAWIVAHRMAEARRLLVHSGERVEEVAARVGYADATHFIRMFRREHGATPAAWRASRRASG